MENDTKLTEIRATEDKPGRALVQFSLGIKDTLLVSDQTTPGGCLKLSRLGPDQFELEFLTYKVKDAH